MYKSSIKPPNRVRELRMEKKLKISELADQLDMSASMLQQIETYKKTISPATLIELANIFDVSIDYILCQTDKKEKNK